VLETCGVSRLGKPLKPVLIRRDIYTEII